MKEITRILAQKYFGNTVEDYAILLGLLLLGFLFKRYLSRVLSNFIYKLIGKWAQGVNKQKLYVLLQKPLTRFIFVILLFTASSHLEFPREWRLVPKEDFGLKMVIYRGYLLLVVISITSIVLKLVEFFGLILKYKAEQTESKDDDQLVPFLVEIAKIVVVTFAVFFALGSVFDVNIGSLIAGLGIGGLALALAAKESLENLLGSFTIFFDKPFVVGDEVRVGTITGVVEKVGFRSTRLRTPEKSFLTVPNKKMIDAELDNLSLRTFRRIEFTIGLVYATSDVQMKNIVADITDYLDRNLNTRHPENRISFFNFGASSLDVRILYFINTMDPIIHLQVRENVNLKIMEIVKKHGSDFAFPTNTIHLSKQNL